MNLQEMFFEELERVCKKDYEDYVHPYEYSKKLKEKYKSISDWPKDYYKAYWKYINEEPIEYEKFLKNRLNYIVSKHNYPIQQRLRG